MHHDFHSRLGSRGGLARLAWFYLFVAMGLFAATTGVIRAEVVNINKADAQTLQQHLRDIGPTRSRAIVDYRKKHGPFKTVDDLAKVPGMGPKLVDKNRRSLSTKKGVYKTDAKTASKGSTTGKPAKPAKHNDKDTKAAGTKHKSTKPAKTTNKDPKATTTKTKKTQRADKDGHKKKKKSDKKKSDKKKDSRKKDGKKKDTTRKSSKSTP